MVAEKDVVGGSMLYMEKEGIHLQNSLAKTEANNPSKRRKLQKGMKLYTEMHLLTFNVELYATSQYKWRYYK